MLERRIYAYIIKVKIELLQFNITDMKKGKVLKIIADLHTHTLASAHAYSTLKENIEFAKETGLSFLGISDHAPALEGIPHESYFHNLKVVRKDWDNLTVLRGAELNILNKDGEVDISEKTLCMLDYTVASLHYPIIPENNRDICTEAAVSVMNNPYVFIIGHPDDTRTPLDYKSLVLAARHNHVALEVNNSSLRPHSYRQNAAENYREMLKLARNMEVSVIVSSDSHIYYDIGNCSLALTLLDEYAFPEELVVNSTAERLVCFFERRKKVALSGSKNSLPFAG